jgi:hypothetical protein
LNTLLNKGLVGFTFLFLLAFLCWFLPHEDNYIRLQDDMDGAYTSKHHIVNSNDFFNPDPSAIVQGSMNGLPRAIWPRFTEPFHVMMYLFGSLVGYSLTFIFLRLVAFFGIYLLGKDYFGFDHKWNLYLILISTGFATLPFNPSYGLTVAGVPLAFWAFFNLLNKKKIILSHLVFLFFAFTSLFVLVGFHICLVFFFMILIDGLKSRKVDLRMIGNVLLLGVWFVLADYMLFYLHVFVNDYESSRQLFNKELGLNFKGVIGTTFIYLFKGEYNASNYPGYLFVPLIVYGTYLVYKSRKLNIAKSYTLEVLGLFFACGFLAALLDWKAMSDLYQNLRILNFFNFKRFITLLPGLFFVVLLIMTSALVQKKIKWSYILLPLFVSMLFLNWRGNISRLKSSFDCSGWTINGDSLIKFNEFMNVNQYTQIKHVIELNGGGNVINFGISPAPCKYNGIRVLDDYQGDYPLPYKIEFRKIIENEINKSEKVKNLFDGWGSKCYLYSANQVDGKLTRIKGFPVEPNLQINTKQLKKMNCHYIISSIIISSPDKLNLKHEKVFVSSLNFQTLFLYKVL